MTGRDVAIVVLVVLGVLVLLPALGMVGVMGGWMGHGMMGWDGRWGGGWGIPAVGLVFWGLIVVGIALAVAALVRRPAAGAGAEPAGTAAGAGPGGRETPLEILKRRLASGEITREEYETLKREVTSP
ncbi:MAG: SHOCT domain-containing protein [Armatimonadota bacterium]|nr:SHOCT domain-containing protein [Armatimonadota bacterium]MDR7485805.1 SHOCT domain-containing protein [Armatimonadota bacterium]MDR7532102.1 SHOCT domain-containing protein [Armatimonadota bacterium]MDR7536691.1 SHOCT domain-containing protein [Armatimonadota bacterium]